MTPLFGVRVVRRDDPPARIEEMLMCRGGKHNVDEVRALIAERLRDVRRVGPVSLPTPDEGVAIITVEVLPGYSVKDVQSRVWGIVAEWAGGQGQSGPTS
jgi:hypothetical protein